MTRKLLIAFLLLSACLASATDYYVAPPPTGSDSNDGSSGSPWATINHAANTVTAGDTIRVAPGTYNEDISIPSTTNGTATSPIVFTSTTPHGAKVVGQRANCVWQIGNGNTAHGGGYVQILNFEIVGGSASNSGICTYGNNNLIKGNLVHDIPGPGCSSNGGGGIVTVYNGNPVLPPGTNHQGYNVFDSNYVYNVGGYPTYCAYFHGLYIGTPYTTIQNNIVFRTSAFGIHIYHFVTNETVVNNTTFLNAASGIIVSSDGSVTDDYTVVENNIAINNSTGSSNANIKERSYPGGYIGTHNVYSNNVTFGDSNGDYDLAVSKPINPITSGSNTSVFVNYTGDSTGDFHLKAGSSAINAGAHDSYTPSLDFDGVTRATPPSVGAYEFVNRPSPPGNLSAMAQ